ncbi:hypothetical protein JCM8547_001579 [Rhodosporidiobolus lusitaniae]
MDDLGLSAPSLGESLLASTNSTIAAPIVAELIDEVDLEQCRLLGPFALVIQGIMGAIVIGSLVLKRMRERPRRKWKIWLADVSKQVVGQAFVHASNVAISAAIATHTSDNPCSLYALNILIDTTLGVLILFYLLRLSTSLMQEHYSPSYTTGYYGTPFELARWGEQAAVYVACLAAMKAVVLVLMWVLPGLEDGMSWLLSWLRNDEAQVFVVMLVLPLVMNLFQFLMVDSFLKDKAPVSVGLDDTDEEALRRGLIGEEEGEDALSDDDEDGHGGRRAGGTPGQDSGYVDDEQDREEHGAAAARGAAANLSSGRAAPAEQGLLDAEEGQSGSLPISASSQRRSAHSYPPRATSIRSTTSSLPPYSTLPPPGAHSQLTEPRRSNETDEDEDWGREWSGSESGEEEPVSAAPSTAKPHPLSSPGQPIHAFPPLSATIASSSSTAAPPPRARSPSSAPVQSQIQPHVRSRSPSPAFSSAPPLVPTQRAIPARAPSPSPTAPSFAGVAAAPASAPAPVPAAAPREVRMCEAEDGDEEVEDRDDWGFGDDEEEHAPTQEREQQREVEPVQEKEPVVEAEPARVEEERVVVPVPEPVQEKEEQGDEEDQWGFEDDDAGAAEQEEEEEPAVKAVEPEQEAAVEEPPVEPTAPSSPPLRPATPPPPAAVPPPSSLPASPPSAPQPSTEEEPEPASSPFADLASFSATTTSLPSRPASPPPAESVPDSDVDFEPGTEVAAPEPAKEEEEEAAPPAEDQEDEEDDWGFGSTSPTSPVVPIDSLSPAPEPVPAPSAIADILSEKTEDSLPVLSEKTLLPPANATFAVDEDDEDDDWGFDSPSIGGAGEGTDKEEKLRSEVDRIVGLKSAGGEKVALGIEVEGVEGEKVD